MEKRKRNKTLDYLSILTGAFLIALAVNVFLVPSKITSGGISTVGTVALYYLRIPLSVTNLVLNAALFVFGAKNLGKKALIKTVLGIAALTVFFEICSYIPAYSEDMIVSALGGGVILGIGLGLVVRTDGSTGGSDFLGIILHKKLTHMSVANIIFLIDGIIIFLSGIAFGSIRVVVYSVVTLFVATFVCDRVLTFGNAAKSVKIISAHSNEISKAILTRVKRGVTSIRCTGMYSGRERLMLMCIVSPRELPKLESVVAGIDPEAFVVINDVKEVLGRGFISRM